MWVRPDSNSGGLYAFIRRREMKLSGLKKAYLIYVVSLVATSLASTSYTGLITASASTGKTSAKVTAGQRPEEAGLESRIAAAGFARSGSLTLNPGESRPVGVIDPAGGFAYFGTDDSPGKIVKVRLSDFTRVDTLTLNSGENDIASALIDTSAGFLYIGLLSFSVPNKIVKVRLSDFTEVATLTLSELGI